MQLPTEPMPWIAAFIESIHLKIDWGMRRHLCQAFLRFDHFFTSYHIPRYVTAWRSVDIDIIGFLLYLARQVDIKLYKLWVTDLSRSVKLWDKVHHGMLSFLISAYGEVSKVALLDSLCTDMLKQYYRMLVRPMNRYVFGHRDLSRTPSRPVDPTDSIAMEGYRFLVDASQEMARFRWTALERDKVDWLWEGTGVCTTIDMSSNPHSLVVTKLSSTGDEWLKQRKEIADSCKKMEKFRQDKMEQSSINSPPPYLVDWSFADGTGPDPAWVTEDDPAIPPTETPNTPRRQLLDRVYSPGRSSPTFASPTTSEINERDEDIRDDDKSDGKSPRDTTKLTKEEAFNTLDYREFMLRRHQMEINDDWEKILEEDEDDLKELYVLLGRRKSLGPKAYITEEVLQLAQNPAEGLVTEHRRHWLTTSWVARLYQHRKGIRLITPADDPVFKHSKYGIKRKRGMGYDEDEDEDEDDDDPVW